MSKSNQRYTFMYTSRNNTKPLNICSDMGVGKVKSYSEENENMENGIEWS